MLKYFDTNKVTIILEQRYQFQDDLVGFARLVQPALRKRRFLDRGVY